ncbi:MAG: glycosyltransferase family 4 protein [Chloroflexi bacterium]|nr:glycosyltransferase family 4 protein [Chloroflexota bacterium]
MAADGHEVTVLTGLPNYPDGVINPPYRGKIGYRETIDGVDVRRVWVFASPSKRARSRLINQFSFMIMTALRGTRLRRPDAILVESHPLFVTLAAGWLRRLKRAHVVLNVSDLWPESAVATGMLRAESLLVKVAARIERWAYNDAAHIIGMSQGIVDGIVAVFPEPLRVSLIKNGVDLNLFKPADPVARAGAREKLGLGTEAFVVAHIGNQSLTYDFDLILFAAAACPDITFLFAGGGSQAAYIESQVTTHRLSNVRLLGTLPHDSMPLVWAAADVSLLAFHDHTVAGTTIPAKIYESFATGTPLVAAIRGEGAALIEKAGAGVIVRVGDKQAFVHALHEMAASPQRLSEMGRAGRAYGEATLSPDAVKAEYLAILESVAKP